MLDWIQAHGEEVFAAIGALYLAARAVVHLTPTPRDDDALERVAAWLRWVASLTGLDLRRGVESAPPSRDERGRAASPVLALVAVALLAGCSVQAGCVTVHQGDVLTVAEVEAAIAAEEATYARTLEVLAVADPARRDLDGLRVRHEARLERLRRWLAYEQAKEPAK